LVAASTRDAVQEVAGIFRREGGAEVTLIADDSSKLATQIVHGAPADLYLSANDRWANFLREKGFAQDITPLLGNTLVIVVPRGNPAHVTRPEDLMRPAVRHIAVAGSSVPAGTYGRQVLKALKLWETLEPKIVSGENVRVTLAYVERGEAEAGIVYATDARIADRVEAVHQFSASTHDPIRYPLVLVKPGRSGPAARDFYAFLQTPQATEVFKKYGFTRLGYK
jgi:molybdate transport system substrate-binding protein